MAAPDYATLTNVKSYLRIGDDADDVFISAWIAAVSRNVDEHCGRDFGIVDEPEERTYRGRWDSVNRVWIYDTDDVFDVGSAVVTTTSGTAVTGEWWPLNAARKGRPYTSFRVGGITDLVTVVAGGPPTAGARITVEATWGWPAIPPAITTAVYLQAARLAARRDSPFGIAGSPAVDGSSELRLLAQLDPDFRTVLKPYVRKWAAR